MESPALATSNGKICVRQDTQSHEVIRQFLVECGTLFRQSISSALVKIWQRELGEIPQEWLQPAFSATLKECEFFPQIANVQKQVKSIQAREALKRLEAKFGPLGRS